MSANLSHYVDIFAAKTYLRSAMSSLNLQKIKSPETEPQKFL